MRTLALVALVAASLVQASIALAAAPAVATGAATSVGARSAVVSGRVDPRGESTSWYVEYGPTTAYGARTEALSAGNGTVAVDVSTQLRGLETGVSYHYRIVASNAAGTARGADAVFRTQGVPEVATGPASLLGPTGATVGGTVDPNGRSSGWWIEYGTTSGYGSRTDTRSAGSGTTPVSVSVRLEGLRAGVEYHFRLVAANDLGTVRGADRAFRTDPAPGVATGSVDSVGVTSARVNGIVDPRGRGTVAWFEYGTTTKLGSRTPDQAVPSRARIYGPLGGLQPGTRVYFRVVARSDAGTAAGETRAFTTSAGPLATTGAAQVSGASVVLTGSVDPVDRATSWWFELGPTTAYGTSTVVRDAGSGRGAVAVSETLAGLTPGSEYHVRLVARSSAGTRRRRVPARRAPGDRPCERRRLAHVGLDRRRRADERSRDPRLCRARPRPRLHDAHRRARPPDHGRRPPCLVPCHGSLAGRATCSASRRRISSGRPPAQPPPSVRPRGRGTSEDGLCAARLSAPTGLTASWAAPAGT